MSSWVRRLQRQLVPSQKVHPTLDSEGKPKLDRDGNPILHSNPPRHVFYGKNLYHGGRGSKLGVQNPKDKALLARKARDEKWGRKS